MSDYKLKITHGIFWFRTKRNAIYCRNTYNYLPLPLKLRNLLELKYLQNWYIKTTMFRFKERVPIEVFVNKPIEFTIAREPETMTWVISIVHPLDQFKRKTGVKIVRERMEFALKYPNNDKRWSYKMKGEKKDVNDN